MAKLRKLLNSIGFIRQWRTGSPEYYKMLHDTARGYQENNWLVSEIDNLLGADPHSVLEIGCGNGRFLVEAKNRGVSQIMGVDWVRSPMLAELGVEDLVQLCDITKDELPRADLVCSADVLEHLAPASLPSTLARIHAAGRLQYHVIACYDDGHSHLSVMPPADWLHRFRKLSPTYQLLAVRRRPGNHKTLHEICVISNYTPSSLTSAGLD
jgi:SAM-dependent methyltransferase